MSTMVCDVSIARAWRGAERRRSRVREGDRPPTIWKIQRQLVLTLTPSRFRHPFSRSTTHRQNPREPRNNWQSRILKSPEAELGSGCLKPGAALEARSHLAGHTAPAAIAARRCLVAAHPGGGAVATTLPSVHARPFFSRPWGLVEGGPSGCALTGTSGRCGCLRGPLFSCVSVRLFPPPLPYSRREAAACSRA